MKSQIGAAEPPTTVARFTVQLSSTKRGARLARRLAVQQVADWRGIPHDSATARAVAGVTAELAANAITHGHSPGRDFRLTLLLLRDVIRVEVTDTRPDRLPPSTAPELPYVEASSGRGLLLVAAYADRWGCAVCDALKKTVWAEVRYAPG